MDQAVVQLITDAINKVDSKVDKLDEKVNSLLSFKWQVVGGTVVISAILGVVIQIIIAAVSR